jgi:hypothetical protein
VGSRDDGAVTPGGSAGSVAPLETETSMTTEGTRATDAVADVATTYGVMPKFEIDHPFSYAITVTNNGPSSASGVRLYVSFSRGVAFDSARPSQGDCALRGGEVVCDLGDLSAGSGTSIAVQITPIVTNVITSTAYVVCNEPDPNTTNNRASETSVKSGPFLIIDPPGTPV